MGGRQPVLKPWTWCSQSPELKTLTWKQSRFLPSFFPSKIMLQVSHCLTDKLFLEKYFSVITFRKFQLNMKKNLFTLLWNRLPCTETQKTKTHQIWTKPPAHTRIRTSRTKWCLQHAQSIRIHSWSKVKDIAANSHLSKLLPQQFAEQEGQCDMQGAFCLYQHLYYINISLNKVL